MLRSLASTFSVLEMVKQVKGSLTPQPVVNLHDSNARFLSNNDTVNLEPSCSYTEKEELEIKTLERKCTPVLQLELPPV